MLPLDDPKWRTLHGGYRTPYDPTRALRSLYANENAEEAWDELWQELHHQGDVGEASYAAVPHLVKIQADIGELDWNAYALIATIRSSATVDQTPRSRIGCVPITNPPGRICSRSRCAIMRG